MALAVPSALLGMKGSARDPKSRNMEVEAGNEWGRITKQGTLW